MLSRVADSLYWTARYLERAEHTVRMIDINQGLMLDKSRTSTERRWLRVLEALGNPKDLTWNGDADELAYALCFDASNRASITGCIISARENARQVREQISTEQWQRLNRLYIEITRPRSNARSETQVAEFLPAVMDGLNLFQGVTDTTLSHGEGWQFLQIGRFIERASASATLLELYHRDVSGDHEDEIDGYEYLEWIGLLRTCIAFEAYCKVYTAELSYERILEFLLLDADFPHSIRYSIDALQKALVAIEYESHRQPAEELMRLSGRLQASLSYGQISEILERDAGTYLRRIIEQCMQIHRLIYEVYIQYSVQTALAL